MVFLFSALITFSGGVAAYSHQELRWISVVTKTYGEQAGKRVTYWRDELSEVSQLPERQKITRVNDFFNQMTFVDDIDFWGQTDYWATPLEFIGSRGGDCEDFTIAKYFSLIELGVPDKKLRLIYVKAIRLNQFHMVLAYYPTPTSQPLILDNLIAEIKPATQRPDLLPIYSFNGQNLWVMKTSQGQLAGKSSRLKLWNDLRDRERNLHLRKPKISLD
ncbi:transglutaminase-like cysteine peptidase [Vibrio hippocampi]|uniref:Sulfate adenylyltransferase n=1 Tax=Vibrio hippocampi TaxID=654686 RepID=A0ABM8ZPG7_9VIBR|nr:transglutaminase-like cysteine peptidase [Vibrio hippocampi]CAH0530391.1 hypothetical protein VHP8226_04034 [Vibrio hippocampi]